MKIGLVNHSFDPARGGSETSTHQFAKCLLEGNHEVHVVARDFPRTMDLDVVPHQVGDVRSRLEFAEAAEDRLRRLSLDVVHDMGVGWHCDVFQPRMGSRTATFEHGLLLMPAWIRPLKRRLVPLLPRYREFRRLLLRQYANRGQIFLALSRMVMRDMQHYHSVPEEQIRVTYNGVDVQHFSPDRRRLHRDTVRRHLGLQDDVLLLFIAAHNFRLKGVPTIIRSVGHLVSQGRKLHLAVAGGKSFVGAQRLAARVGAAEAVTFLGTVNDMVAYYAAADVYVHPTFYDPCSRAVLEAMACGLPVITTPFNGLSELMTEGREGLLLQDPSDPVELTQRLLPLFDAATRARMGRAARELALQHSLERSCKQILDIYAELRRSRTPFRRTA